MKLCSNTHLMPLLQAQFLVLLFFCLEFCICTDTITSTQFISDPETIISNGTIFKLGFFSPVNSTNRYVGIVYNAPMSTMVWVANRERPLNDSFGTVTISKDGNLVVLDGQKGIIWSSNVLNSVMNSSAQLLDNGNLILQDNSNGRVLWESFQHPSDSFLQKMRISARDNTNEKFFLKSWKSPSDPSVGTFSAGLDAQSIPQFFVWNGSYPHWRSGPWNALVFTGIPKMDSVYNSGFRILGDEGSIYVTFTYANESTTYYVLNSSGTLIQKSLVFGKEDWEATWWSPEDECDVYGKCGLFGSCNLQDSPICTCLKGFEPKQIEEWRRGNWSSGCVRRTYLQCDKNSTNGEKGKEDGFLKLNAMKVPDFAEWSKAVDENCGRQCLNNCSCIAYAYDIAVGCMQWSGRLIDIKKFSGGFGMDLYIRVAYSELDKKRNMKVVIVITLIIGSITIAMCIYFSWKWMTKRREKPKSEVLLFKRGKTYLKYSNEGNPRDNMNQLKFKDLPLYNFEMLANATENFHSANKLGQGGFGAVYKGKLQDGQEIAVKRLSRSSGQGMEEFMNEVVVISKLQHRNLVRLLGCCVEGAEKMLIYEYMPNKSLDAFLFDPLKQKQLHWSKRGNIIEGISRGLLYLHRDSRLRIIHRDLKASNILLDEDLNPKISDFGMARIFGGNQDQADTRRVVGTYGYMAPEYAMEGRFSDKSDVFSFGVLLLEIVSGRRNNSFYHDEHALSLLGFAWKLWNEDKIVDLADTRISDPCFQMEILRCIHVGLLCVQEFAKDRPTVSTILSMLSSEIVDLPTPKQPAFTERQTSSDTVFPRLSHQKYSANNVTITMVDGR